MENCNTKSYKKGDIIYSIRGQEGEYICYLDGGHLVSPVYENEEQDFPNTYFGEPEKWKEVFLSPPREKLNKNIQELEEKRQEILKGIDEARDKWREFQKEETERKNRIKAHEKLANLDLFLNGQITHYLAETYGAIRVWDINEPNPENHSNRKVGGNLLILRGDNYYGSAGRKLDWFLNMGGYYDSSYKVIPCTSTEELISKLNEIVALKFKEYLEGKPNIDISNAISMAEKYNIEVPKEVIEKQKRAKITAAQNEIDKINTSLKKAADKLKEVSI